MSTFSEQITAAVGAHGQWKARLHLAIEAGASEFSVPVVRQDNQCPFGKWLYAEGKSGFHAAADFEHVRRLHTEFHLEAAKVLGLAITGHKADAEKAMAVGSGFSKASSALTVALRGAQPKAAKASPISRRRGDAFDRLAKAGRACSAASGPGRCGPLRHRARRGSRQARARAQLS